MGLHLWPNTYQSMAKSHDGIPPSTGYKPEDNDEQDMNREEEDDNSELSDVMDLTDDEEDNIDEITERCQCPYCVVVRWESEELAESLGRLAEALGTHRNDPAMLDEAVWVAANEAVVRWNRYRSLRSGLDEHPQRQRTESSAEAEVITEDIKVEEFWSDGVKMLSVRILCRVGLSLSDDTEFFESYQEYKHPDFD